jgi:hypothetical protein
MGPNQKILSGTVMRKLMQISMQIPNLYKDLRGSCGVGVPLIPSIYQILAESSD